MGHWITIRIRKEVYELAESYAQEKNKNFNPLIHAKEMTGSDALTEALYEKLKREGKIPLEQLSDADNFRY